MNEHLPEDEIARWVSGERTATAERHLRECPRCAAEVDETEKALALFREAGHAWSGRWYGQRPVLAPRPSRRVRPLAAVAAMCVLAVAVLLYAVRTPRQAAASAETPFLVMPYVAPLAPYERAEVVRMDVSVAELTAAGLEVHVPNTGATVLADVVIGQDGRMHAIRLVSSTASNRDRSIAQ